MQRGFKSRCEQISKRYRKALGLTLEDALPYEVLADHLGILVWTPEDVPGLEAQYIHQLVEVDNASWSAVTIRIADKNLIIANSSHNHRRMPNNVIHEIAHILLDHVPARIDISEAGHLWLSSYGRDQEDEANWLAGALLVPREGLLNVYMRTQDIRDIARQFQVSVDLARMRVNVTGIAKQIRRRRRA